LWCFALGHEGIEVVVAGLACPKRPDKADEAVIQVWFPTPGCGTEDCGSTGNDRWLVVFDPHHQQAFFEGCLQAVDIFAPFS
jgi:hypothetical protein